MINKKVFLALIIFITLFLSVFITGAGNVVQKKFMSNQDKNLVFSAQNSLLNMDNNSAVRVFVRMNKDSLKLTKKESIGGEGKIRDKSFSALLNKSEIEELYANPSVQSITRIPVRYINLQDSVSLINATVTYPLQINSLNLTGKGQTVCIIDTGVNYSHSSLGGCYGNNDPSSTCKVIGGWDYCSNDVTCGDEDDDPIDVNGHGTHVAGIVAANGSINGVAPEANIIMMKAGNASGAFSDEDLLKAFDWCVGNSSTFNISVISMSLGSVVAYETYCDDEFDSDPSDYVARLNSAIAKNISVVISSGNDGYYNAISAPACLSGAIPVTSTNKGDNAISSFASTWNDSSLNILAAPGENINSTYRGTYLVENGTSMSAPHVAGAVALMRQYLSLVNRTKTPSQIESALNNTGKQIYDSYANRNFSRINIYDAVIGLDIDSPNVTLISPSPSVSIDVNQTFRCNVTDLALKNMTFYLWNSSSVYNSTYSSLSGGFNSFELNITNIPTGNYNWNCYYYDRNNNFGLFSSNYSLNITTDISVLLVSPEDDFGITANDTFMCNATSLNNLTNMTFYLWNSTGLEYSLDANVTGLTNESSVGYNFTHEDRYKWNCLFRDDNSTSKFHSSNYTLYYDLTSPNVSLSYPAEGYSATGTTTVSFEFNVTDNINVSSCNLIVNGANVSVNNSGVNGAQYISYSLSPGSYTWSINCTDKPGNTFNSSTRSITVSQPATSSGGGGGGGGGSATPMNSIYIPTNEQLNSGYTKDLKSNDAVKFITINNATISNHNLTITNVGGNTVDILVRSSPVYVTLSVGEEKKLSLDSFDKYNLLVKLNSINSSKANLTIRQIDEPIISENYNQTVNLSDRGNKKIVDSSYNNYYTDGIILVIALIILILFYYLYKKRKRKISRKKGR